MEWADIAGDRDSATGSGYPCWQALDSARVRAELAIPDLWLLYFAYTGTAGPLEVDAYLNGMMPLPSPQHDILVFAVNERLSAMDLSGQLPYQHLADIDTR
jgi:hypothetical protein